MLGDAEFWVAVAFVIFGASLGVVGVHRKLLQAIDQRGARIQEELGRARDLRHEAEAIHQQSKNRLREIESEVERIMDAARAEAHRLTSDARTKASDLVHRRTKLAEVKIAQAEQEAIADIRAVITDIATSAAEDLLRQSVHANSERLFVESIKVVKAEAAQ
jgi:F-type H+-transporting ATPase subunit b